MAYERVPGFGAARAVMTGQFTRIAVTVTFLRQDQRPTDPAPRLPADTSLIRVAEPTVEFYRYLYNTAGAPYVWWLRRTVPDQEIAEMLANPAVSLHVLYRGGAPCGFFELEDRGGSVNISYFGLLPHAVGRGLGTAFLRASIDAAWHHDTTVLTVNTCTADHPRALPNYLRAGFVPYRTLREIWDVPNRLGLVIPAQLRV